MNNTLLKGLAILELLSHSPRPLSLTQIAAELGVAKSNVHRLMQALSESRYVTRHEDSGGYMASIKLWELGSAVLAKLDLRLHAEQEMESLQEQIGESVHLSVLDGVEVVYVHKVDSLNPVRAYTQIGGRVPAYCVATGKAQLAFAGESMLAKVARQLQPFTPHTIIEPALFLKEMSKVRAQGYAVNRGEWREGVWGIAAPVMGARGMLIAGVGISGPGERLRKRNQRECAEFVMRAAVNISSSLGGTAHLGPLVRLGAAAK